jgi:site-specific DNA-cytosine methylase
VLALAASLSACGTPQPARDLASQGAVLADKAQAEADDFTERAQAAYRRREAIVRGLAEGEIRDTTAGDFRAWIAAEAGVPTDRERIALITRIADRSKLMREERETAFVAKAKQLEDARGPAIKASNTNLAEARKAFIVLSQELSPSEGFKFAQSYVKQVRADLKALEAAEAADATPATAPAQPAAP